MDECPRLRVEVSQPLVTEKLRRLAGNLDQGRHFHPHAVPEPLQVPGDRRPEQKSRIANDRVAQHARETAVEPERQIAGGALFNTSETYEKYEFT